MSQSCKNNKSGSTSPEHSDFSSARFVVSIKLYIALHTLSGGRVQSIQGYFLKSLKPSLIASRNNCVSEPRGLALW